MSERRYLTADEAIGLLPDGEEIHTQVQQGMIFFGANWSREDIIDKIRKSDVREITGLRARRMGHGLALYNNDVKWQSEILFVETDKARLDAFDPLDEET